MGSSLEKPLNQIICGDAKEDLLQLPAESIDCVVTSPPYWALREYGVRGQLGLESSFAEYVDKLCGVFDEVRRVLKPTGTCWVNLGDTYGGSGTSSAYTSRFKGNTSLLPDDLSYDREWLDIEE
jgi:DNA modification methylase